VHLISAIYILLGKIRNLLEHCAVRFPTISRKKIKCEYTQGFRQRGNFGNLFSGFENLITLSVILRHLEAELIILIICFKKLKFISGGNPDTQFFHRHFFGSPCISGVKLLCLSHGWL
jgi:hypothetical protein